nr:proteasome 26S non ATPase subunit 12 [Hymenolepis microstoma]
MWCNYPYYLASPVMGYVNRARLVIASVLRLCMVCFWAFQEAEDCLCKLVVKKTVQAKIDRLENVVRFTENKLATDILNDWSHNVSSLMSLINEATHLINKERMVHSV